MFNSVQLFSPVRLFTTPWSAARHMSLSITNSRSSCPLSRWCHPTISSFVVLFSSHLQSCPASGSFPMNQFFASGGQSIGVSASTSVLPMNIQDWFPLRLTGLTISSVQSLSRVQLFATLWNTALQVSLSTTNSQSSPKLIFIESVMPSNHLILCCPLLPPSIFSSIMGFSNESVFCIRWPNYWGFSFSISPSNEYSGLISFRMD